MDVDSPTTMAEKNSLSSHLRRWNLQFSSEAQLGMLRNRVLILLENQAGTGGVLEAVERAFCWKLGLKPAHFRYLPGDFERSTMGRTIRNVESPSGLAVGLRALCEALNETEEIGRDQLDAFKYWLQDAINNAPAVGIAMGNAKSVPTFYPAGAKLLDEDVIDPTLEWLDHFPTAKKNFEQALTIFLNHDTPKFRALLDNLRFSLENAVQGILKNKKSLENQEKRLAEWLGERGAHSHIVNLFRQVVKSFADYQNSAVKHDEAFSEKEIEFHIYLTATLLRLIATFSEG